MPSLLAQADAVGASGTGRRVHSPSAATRTIVVVVTAVCGSTNASTPRRVRTNSSRYLRSADFDEAPEPLPRRRRSHFMRQPYWRDLPAAVILASEPSP